MPFTICTWNINSVRLRLDQVERFLAEQQPDPVESIRFVPFAKIEAFNSVLRRRPDGGDLAEQICTLLLDHYGSSAKPVLLLRRNGNHWLGMLDYCPESRERQHRITHLHRCLAAS